MNRNYKLIFSTLSLIAILVTACSAGTPARTSAVATTPPPAAATSTGVQPNALTATPQVTPENTATATALPDSDPTLPALSPDIWEMHTYHNAAHGITFDYPGIYDDRHDLNCAPRTQKTAGGVTVSI